ncbi:MAG: helix-turn-helix domain-containing protein, partial [Chlamydiia bacterium]|nr:helix-turn-helix domain-containing protein [Chlamydiia bacterium]
MKEMIKMTLKEAERLSVMRQVDKKNLTLRKASEELGLSLRQTKRIRKRYKEGG